MKKALVVMGIILAAIVPLSGSSALASAKGEVIAVSGGLRPVLTSKAKVSKPKPVTVVKVKVNIGRSQDRRYDDRRGRRNNGGIKIALGSVKITLGAGSNRYRDDRHYNDSRSRYVYRDQNYDNNYRSSGGNNYRDDCRGGVVLPGISPDDPAVHRDGSVQYLRNGYVVGEYQITEIRRDGVYGRRAVGIGRVFADDEHTIY